jgi:hypothetical protein
MKSLVISFFALCTIQFSAQAQTLINHKGNDIFMSGINIAWMEFGNDLTNFNKVKFTAIMKDVAAAGGNSVRWWIHVDGRSTPTYTSDTVTGISAIGLDNLETALDIAAENGIVVSLCLWSFDMMTKQNTNETEASYLARVHKNRILVEDSAATQAYIDHALIPMVTRLSGHTAILCWEIFNEPEGMTTLAGWQNVDKVSMIYIQRFINRCAGAIHKTDPTAKVSNGSWNAMALVDINAISSTNYYTDAALIAAGGDTEGTLDFYMLHFYAEYNGNKYSPFHNPVAYWELDKPLLIGEFAAHGIINAGKGFVPTTQLTTTQSLSFLYDNGYAGGWGWTYTAHDGYGGLSDMKYVMDSLKTVHPEHIIIPRDPSHNYAPIAKTGISDTVLFVNSNTITNYINLNNYFEDEAQLSYSIAPNGPATISIINDSLVNVTLIPDSTGISMFTVVATDNGGKTASSLFSIVVRDSIITSTNKLLYALVSSSSEEDSTRRRPLVNDGDMTTRWSSIYNDAEWIEFDMLQEETISKIVLNWEAAYADKYEILVSSDNQNWTTVFEMKNGQTAKNNIIIAPTLSRYIRINFTKRASGYGYSLFEIQAYENSEETNNVAPTAKTTPFSISMKAYFNFSWKFPRSNFMDANGDVLELSATLANGNPLPAWLTFNTATFEFIGIPQLDDTATYNIQVTATDWFNQKATYNFPIYVKDNRVGIDGIAHNTSAIYPNPNSTGNCTIELNTPISSNAKITITNSLGKKISSVEILFNQGIASMDISKLPNGVYFVTIVAQEKVYTQTLIVK